MLKEAFENQSSSLTCKNVFKFVHDMLLLVYPEVMWRWLTAKNKTDSRVQIPKEVLDALSSKFTSLMPLARFVINVYTKYVSTTDRLDEYMVHWNVYRRRMGSPVSIELESDFLANAINKLCSYANTRLINDGLCAKWLDRTWFDKLQRVTSSYTIQTFENVRQTARRLRGQYADGKMLQTKLIEADMFTSKTGNVKPGVVFFQEAGCGVDVWRPEREPYEILDAVEHLRCSKNVSQAIVINVLEKFQEDYENQLDCLPRLRALRNSAPQTTNMTISDLLDAANAFPTRQDQQQSISASPALTPNSSRGFGSRRASSSNWAAAMSQQQISGGADSQAFVRNVSDSARDAGERSQRSHRRMSNAGNIQPPASANVTESLWANIQTPPSADFDDDCL